MELKKVSDSLKKLTRPEKPKSESGNLFDIFSEAKKKAQELKQLHKEFFEASQKTKKDELKRRIENLEWELIETSLSEQNKISSLKKLEQYKKTNIKPFFLWRLNFAEVFQEKGGFDIVIANPPYIDSESMVKSGDSEIRNAIQRTYSWTKGNWDIYIAFFELGFREMNKNGVLTYITPDKWIAKPFGDEFRKGVIKNIFVLLKAGRKIFKEAKVDSIITFFASKHSDSFKIINFEEGKFIFKREVNKSSLLSPFTLDHLFSENLDFLLELGKLNKRVSDFSECENACATSDAYKLAPLIKSLSEDKFNKENFLKIINTGTIGKYYMKWGKQEMTYLKNKYLYPVVERKEFLDTFKNSYAIKSLKPKIIIKGLNLLDGCLDQEGDVIPGKTTLVITDNDIQKLKFLLTIINSKLAIFYIKERYPSSSYNQGVGFTKDMINNFPIPNVDGIKRNELVSFSDEISSIAASEDYLGNKEKQNKVLYLRHEIDELLYQLYGLAPEEIAVVEGKS